MSVFKTFKCSSCFEFLAAPGCVAFKSPLNCGHYFCEDCKEKANYTKFCKKLKCAEAPGDIGEIAQVDLTAQFEAVYQSWLTSSDKKRCEVHKQQTHIGGMVC